MFWSTTTLSTYNTPNDRVEQPDYYVGLCVEEVENVLEKKVKRR